MPSVQYLNFDTRAFKYTFKGSTTHVQRSAQGTSAQPDEFKKQSTSNTPEVPSVPSPSH